MVSWTEVQYRRLKELGAPRDDLDREWADAGLRDREFQQIEARLARRQRALLQDFVQNRLRPRLVELERRLTDAFVARGFAQVTTPIIMSGSHLARMSIADGHPLLRQIYWLDGRQCLRPMLAPHLYYVMKDLVRLCPKPLRFFEVGPCFRKETQGARHTSEFTMLNLVEAGIPEAERTGRLEEMGSLVASTAGLRDFQFASEKSDVYGDTIDMVAGPAGIEVGSAAMGPHPLDAEWGIIDTWVGFGFGLERLLMAADGSDTLGRYCRNLGYLDGIRLRI